VVAVACDTLVPAGARKTIRADALAARVPGRGWQTMSCGPGSKGERLYDWALSPAGNGRHLLIRRSITSGELAFYLCWSPRNATLAELVKVAGARWAVGPTGSASADGPGRSPNAKHKPPCRSVAAVLSAACAKMLS
jgi:hypothetical protein